jgi:hypothetical protein
MNLVATASCSKEPKTIGSRNVPSGLWSIVEKSSGPTTTVSVAPFKSASSNRRSLTLLMFSAIVVHSGKVTNDEAVRIKRRIEQSKAPFPILRSIVDSSREPTIETIMAVWEDGVSIVAQHILLPSLPAAIIEHLKGLFTNRWIMRLALNLNAMR